MTIPEIRERLHELAKLHGMPELAKLAEATRRNPGIRPRVKRASQPCTPEMARDIRRYAERNPEQSLDQIAAQFDVNPGRVSEAIRYVR